MTSLRARAVAGGIIWTVITAFLGFLALSSYLTAQSQSRFIELLQTRHTQAVVAVANGRAAPELIGTTIGGAVYQRPFSGQYWQVEDSEGTLYTSPSLVDALLPLAEGTGGELESRRYQGPGGQQVIGLRQWITFDDGSRWHVQVAASLDELYAERAQIWQTFIVALGIVVLISVLGTLLQVYAMLRPLEALRRDVLDRWENEDGLDVKAYPVEVAPLVSDINALIGRNRDIAERSRRQAADLAHAIKTPSAIMRNELETLEGNGVPVAESLDALRRLDAQLNRSLARIRAGGGDGQVGVVTQVDTSLGRMERAFGALARNAGRSFSASYANGLQVRMDQHDFEEVIGNLLDNAMKFSKSTFSLTAQVGSDKGHPALIVTIADDGPGIPAEERATVMQGGRRLDTTKPGTGLGLGIATELVTTYDGALSLDRSESLGGLEVTLRLPLLRKRKPA